MKTGSDIEGRRVLVVGLGYRTGLAAANFLAARGARVTVSDIKSAEALRDVIDRLDRRVAVRAGEQGPSLLDEGADMVVLSPGVPASIPLITEAHRRGIPVLAEVELASRYMRGMIAAITGTDGKSTTTSLVGYILAAVGVDARVGGNIGIPLVSLVEETGPDSVSVVELSSFQLETIDKFRPDVSAVLNISPDHLDRYDGMDDYLRAKMRITGNQAAGDVFVYNRDDLLLSSNLGSVRARRLGFSLDDDAADAFRKDGAIYLRSRGGLAPAVEISRMRIMGVHNVQNAMAALLIVTSVLEKAGREADPAAIADACCSFAGLPHRMERLGSLEGRLFINDSKATTVGAVEMALRSLPGKGVLILGGQTKGDDYSRLRASVRERARGLVLIGESSREFSRIFSDVARELAADMDDAAVRAMRMSEKGDVILLSPACASFDMFRNFEDRGEAFRRSFEKLSKGALSWT